MSNKQEPIRVRYIGVVKHGFLWLKQSRCWVIEKRFKNFPDINGVDHPHPFRWVEVSRVYNDRSAALQEANLWRNK